MKNKLSLTFLVLNLFFNTAFAQSLPPGPYQQTCQSIQLIGTELRAICEGGPPYLMTFLYNATNCEAPIENIRGNLVCPSERSQSYVIPGGPYQSSCKFIELLGGVYLRADCLNSMGYYNQSQLNLSQCQNFLYLNGQAQVGDIYNMNGQLSCP